MENILKIKIRELNPHIVCLLCAGYFIDATTITECLHTFCKSCIVKYLQTSKCCPMCNVKVHETQPLLNLKADRTLQEIVFKVVPTLWENEMKRQVEFEKARNSASYSKDGAKKESMDENDMPGRHLYIHDELIHICIEPLKNGPSTRALIEQGEQRFIRCSVRAQIYHLKKLIRKLWEIPSLRELEVTCNGQVISENHCLKRVWLSFWKEQSTPLVLHFSILKVP